MTANHWHITTSNGVTTYHPMPTPPSERSSRILADEINGLTRSEAVKVLREMYDEVVAVKGGENIICRMEDHDET